MNVIEQELHTDAPSKHAAWRMDELLADKKDLVAPAFQTGALQAQETEDWVYGINRKALAPQRSGLNVSFNALTKGTGVDERALPNRMRGVMLKETDKVIKKRRKFARDRAKTKFSVPKEFEEAIGLVREKPKRDTRETQ